MKNYRIPYRLGFILFTLFCTFSFPLFAGHHQFTDTFDNPPANPHVYFTNEIPVSGIAKEYNELFIKAEGGYAYLVVDQYPNNFSYDQLKVKIFKNINGTSTLYDNKTYNINTSNYYTYIKYKFFSTGSYIFDVYNKYDAFVGTGYLTISLSNSSSGTTFQGCTSGLREYLNDEYRVKFCIPNDSYITVNTSTKDALTINNFYEKKLEISFNNEPDEGIDKYDLSIVSLVRSMMGSMYSDYYRKEFKLLNSKTDRVVYRSIVVGITTDGKRLESSIFYVKLYGRKIHGYDYMIFSGPYCDASEDISYQVIMEVGMIGKMIVY